LIGTMQNVQAEHGLLVSWGGFKATVRQQEAPILRCRVARPGAPGVHRWGAMALVSGTIPPTLLNDPKRKASPDHEAPDALVRNDFR
jgi:hypothetical protein